MLVEHIARKCILLYYILGLLRKEYIIVNKNVTRDRSRQFSSFFYVGFSPLKKILKGKARLEKRITDDVIMLKVRFTTPTLQFSYIKNYM